MLSDIYRKYHFLRPSTFKAWKMHQDKIPSHISGTITAFFQKKIKIHSSSAYIHFQNILSNHLMFYLENIVSLTCVKECFQSAN